MKYKVGDKVRVVQDLSLHEFKIGEVVTVTQVNRYDYLCAPEDCSVERFVAEVEIEPVRKSLDDATSAEWDKASCYTNKLEEGQEAYCKAIYSQIDDDLDDMVAASSYNIGSSDYSEMRLQPLEATYLRYGYNGMKAAIHTKVDKYLTRDKGTEVEDIEKSIHCLELLLEKAKENYESNV